MNRTSLRWVAVCVLAGLSWTIGESGGAVDVAHAQATQRLVSTTGVDVGDCTVSPCRTIQFAVDIASPGDVILVASGIYNEHLVIATNDLTLRGAGATSTTIRSDGRSDVVFGIDLERFSIEGFTLTNAAKQPGSLPGGAAIYLYSNPAFSRGDWIVRNNILQGNGHGFALALTRPGDGTAVIENNLIANNTFHGILNLSHTRVVIRNNTIADNGWFGYAENAGGADNVIVNNIVAFNGAAFAASCPECTGPTGIVVGGIGINDISFNNAFGNTNANYGQYSSAGFIPYTPLPGTGEISVDPLFLDSANGDYRLAPASPSVDAGTNDNAPTADLDGLTRPVDGDGDGTPVTDMGAFEAQEVPDNVQPAVSASADPSAVPARGHATFPVQVSGSVTDASGVNPTSGTFSVTDEYGEVEPQGTFTIGANGQFVFVVALEASRRGNDRDGREYLITVTAADTAGNVGIASTRVRVLHDQRR